MARSKNTDKHHQIPKQSTFNNLHARMASQPGRIGHPDDQPEEEVEGTTLRE